MTWNVTRVTEPSEPLISLEDAKLHLRVVHDDEDTLIERIVEAAAEQCEAFQRRAFVTQTLQLTLPRFPRGRYIRLPRPPLQTVDSIEYVSRDGDTVEVSDNLYRAVSDTEPGCVMLVPGAAWPSDVASAPDAVRVTYTAGYGDAADVPKAARSAALLFAGHLYENREAGTVGSGPPFRLPLGPEYLLRSHQFTMTDPLGGD